MTLNDAEYKRLLELIEVVPSDTMIGDIVAKKLLKLDFDPNYSKGGRVKPLFCEQSLFGDVQSDY